MSDQSPLPTSFRIDGTTYPALSMPLKPSWVEAAAAKGFDLTGRVIDRFHGVLRCRTCGTLSLKRLNVIRDANPLCHACIHTRRAAAAEALGATLLRSDPDDRHYGHYRLSCGHTVRRQYLRVEKAADGGHDVGCETCREARYDTSAQDFGWTLEGLASDRRTGYRRYRHHCGHSQEILVGNMLWGDCTCGGCGSGWSAAPSFVYLFRIDLPGLQVVKLGYSARPVKRLRHQLGISRDVRTEVLRVMLLASGNLAVREERACHRQMRETHPDQIVPKAVFGDAINTLSEIYYATAAPLLHALMDEIGHRHPSDSTGN